MRSYCEGEDVKITHDCAPFELAPSAATAFAFHIDREDAGPTTENWSPMPLRNADHDARFDFGKNWQHFLRHLDDARIRGAEDALRTMLGVHTLSGKTFLDIGSGSGLSSLAARRLGAKVHAFDYDPHSVACTQTLKERYFPDDTDWTVEHGSALDADYMRTLGNYDVVYSWGVLHHTGQMWRALENAGKTVRDGGTLFIAIYNDQGWISRYWAGVKRLYNANPLARGAMILTHAPYLFGARWLVRTLKGRGRLERGMTLWYDMIDWLGGYPFEVATPAQIKDFCAAHGLHTTLEKTCGRRHGCNEYILQKTHEK